MITLFIFAITVLAVIVVSLSVRIYKLSSAIRKAGEQGIHGNE